MSLSRAVEASVLLAEKTASLRPSDPGLQDAREKSALADFWAYGLLKTAGLEEVLPLMKKPLAWGVGLGLPALGVGHSLLHGARDTSADILRDARNQALLTAAGVGGMQGLGGLLQHAMTPRPSQEVPTAPDEAQQRLAADRMVDDLLEDACSSGSAKEKHAALVHLIVHRGDAMRVVRSLLK